MKNWLYKRVQRCTGLCSKTIYLLEIHFFYVYSFGSVLRQSFIFIIMAEVQV